ncbi:E3 ubiquitin/ISG15 ligase TRIM25-like isoform X1 [Alosa sapidissima]|uniref:E3 ubiquitin/ISG15 ligase TRIM25-like isoform X1 n=1 Tax=Alosa sapidissima TaxID=34773 RepID=UPI001C091EF4|nr:E3 ubiquitin/ISG15 ligase TRIM25-like isoform X1 [Alosa sapidissima]
MADGQLTSQESFMCSVCLDLLRDPVTVPCGHSYCMGCIENHWRHERAARVVYSCPQCRQSFTSKPDLRKNVLLAQVVENLRNPSDVQVAPLPDCCYAGPGDVECDVCTGRKLKAAKSCLECLVSYCESHIGRHDELFSGKRHVLVKASPSLKKRICPRHHRLTEVFCWTDQQGLCYQCMLEGHKSHDTVSAAEERQKQEQEMRQKIKQGIQVRMEKLPEVKTTLETLKRSAQIAVEDSERIFTEMIRSIERRRSEVKELIKAQEKAEVSRAEGLLKQLEQEIADLRRSDAELEQLSHTDDHIFFLKNFQSLYINHETKDLLITNASGNPFDKIKRAVSYLRDQLNDFKLEKGIASIETVNPVVLLPVPKTRMEFLHYVSKLTLDPNTAFKHLRLSEKSKMVSLHLLAESYSDHPERFDSWAQVLCREGVSGRCYWEVEWSGRVAIAVSYKSISRKGGGNECGFGYNDQSWCLDVFKLHCLFRHNNKEVRLPVVHEAKIGVYVDHRAGVLAFYSISDTMTLLHRVQTTFTHTLYPGFWCRFQVIDMHGSTVKILS